MRNSESLSHEVKLLQQDKTLLYSECDLSKNQSDSFQICLQNTSTVLLLLMRAALQPQQRKITKRISIKINK